MSEAQNLMTNDPNSARPITNPEEAWAVLNSPKASFVELMDCAETGRRFNDAQLRRQAAEKSMEEVLNRLDNQPGAHQFSIHEAARHVAAATLKAAKNLDDLAPYLARVTSWLSGLNKRIRDLAPDEIRELETAVSEIALLLTDPNPESQSRLCSRLRKVERSDLGILAAERCLEVEPDNIIALTTKAAAQLDIGAADAAVATASRAVRLAPKGHHARTVLSRAFQETGRPRESLEAAREALDISANKFTAHRVLSAAAALNDADEFKKALELLEDLEKQGRFKDDVLIKILAVEALYEAGDLSTALELFDAVMTKGFPVSMSRRFAQLRVKLRRVQQAQLPGLEDRS